MTPTEARLKENSSVVFNRLYPKQEAEKPTFAVGDIVRISKVRQVFKKGYQPSWSGETFKIRMVHDTVPVTYLLEDLQGQEITGGFYKQELQATDQSVFWYKKLRTRIRDGKKQYYVRWIGYPDSQNSWIDESDITEAE